MDAMSNPRVGRRSRVPLVPRGGAAWGERGFRPLAVSYAINELGDLLGLVALAILVLDRTESAWATTALFLASKFVPALAAPALTALLDQRPVGHTLPLLYSVEALAFCGLALLEGAFWLPAVLALAFLDGLLALTARGLSRGAIATVLRPVGALREGNGILNVIFAVTGVVGPLLGAVLVHEIGVAAALWADAGSFLAVALLLALSASRLPRPTSDRREGWIARVRDGLGYVRSHPVAGRLVAGEAVAIVFFTIVVPIQVVYVTESLGAPSAAYGLLMATWGGGIVLGSAYFAKARRAPLGRLVLASTAAVGLGYLGMALAPTLAVACAASVLGGAGNGVQWVSVMTALQESVDAEYQARASGMLESVAAAMPGIGFALGGLLTALVSPRLAYVAAAVGTAVVVVVWARRPLVGRPGAEPPP